MAKRAKSKLAAVPKVDPYLEGVVAKLLDRLVGLEKKIDTLIARAAGSPSGSGSQAAPQAKQPQRRERQYYEAVCADCHKVCDVPFRPSEDRPVYCKECFAKRKAGAAGKSYPVMTPVAMPPKPPVMQTAAPAPQTAGAPKKAKKSRAAKAAKKK